MNSQFQFEAAVNCFRRYEASHSTSDDSKFIGQSSGKTQETGMNETLPDEEFFLQLRIQKAGTDGKEDYIWQSSLTYY
jgi:hypothetical protein